MSEWQKLFDAVESLQVQNQTFVYFDVETGEISSIGNRKDTDSNYIEVNSTEVAKIMSGEKHINDYKVIFDVGLKDYQLRERGDLETENDHVYNTLHEISSLADNADVIITQDTKNKKWTIKVTEDLRSYLRSEAVSINSNIFFSVTAKHDPNIFYRSLDLKVDDLIKSDFVEFPFKFRFEFDKEDVSIYTAKYFESYQYEKIT